MYLFHRWSIFSSRTVFGNFFSFARRLFSPLKQIALVSFRSFLASGTSFAFFLSKIINSGVFARTTTRSDECAKRKAVAYHRLIDFALFVCVRARESERAACARPDTTFFEMEENVRERGSAQREQPKDRKNTSPFLSRGTRKRRTMISGARESRERERRSRWRCVCGRFK